MNPTPLRTPRDARRLLFGAFSSLVGTLADNRERAAHRPSADSLALANIKPRLRMVTLYYYANVLCYLVLGTGNRDELSVGYYTKFGDGACDGLPLGDLVKAEVRALAAELGVPRPVIDRPPTAGLWPGQTDEGELGFSYELLDRFLLQGSSGVAAVDAAILRRRELARHKAAAPPVAHPE